ncbi:hypothetical protein OYT1_ch2452 [Ferriphaselus amnicola]|uniref:Uncharacterized protein n=1 Tax=Ferriphaselus amnicola TaxID=1188319 RepID=A0A2Z6GFP2_9PROT|nr:hypothetical protein [Ferriphaselus amnicola]BBE51965.1 hypothetical protein OYT1_ch2452 [Ferriphaselus amnicola]
MSYFVCGSITLVVASPQEQEMVARRASSQALQVGMALQLGCNIVQSLVSEIIERSDNPSALPFLVTASPLSDTSDELVSPYVLVGSEGDERFQQHAKAIATLFKSLTSEEHVQRIDLYVVDGFDTTIPTKSILITALEDELLSAWRNREQDFFFRLILRKLVPLQDTLNNRGHTTVS